MKEASRSGLGQREKFNHNAGSTEPQPADRDSRASMTHQRWLGQHVVAGSLYPHLSQAQKRAAREGLTSGGSSLQLKPIAEADSQGLCTEQTPHR